MRYLIDTNVFIKIIKDYDIFDDIKDILENYENIIYVSYQRTFAYIYQT